MINLQLLILDRDLMVRDRDLMVRDRHLAEALMNLARHLVEALMDQAAAVAAVASSQDQQPIPLQFAQLFRPHSRQS